MAAFQERHWRMMIRSIDDYKAGELELRDLVGMLEGSLYASELKDEKLQQEFFNHWGPLEDALACAKEIGTPIDRERMRTTADRMKEFLTRTLDDVKAYDPSDY